MFGSLENAVEGGKAAETGTHCHFGNGNIRLNQQAFRVGNPFLRQIFVTGCAGKLLKQSGKVELGKAGQVSQIIHADIFCAMVGYVIADVHEFFYIFVLFV